MASFGGITAAVWRAFGFGTVGNKEGEQRSGPVSLATESGQSVTDQRALQVSAVWACTRILVNAVSCLPFPVYKRDGDDTRSKDRDHWLWGLLRDSPNAYTSPLAFRQAMTAQLVLWGNAFALIKRRGNQKTGQPTSLIPVLPECVKVIRTGDAVTYHVRDGRTGSVRVFSQASMLHLKQWGPDGVMGLSPLDHMRQSLGVSVSADKFAARAFGSNGKPSGVLMVDRFLTAEQREDMKEIYQGMSVDDDKLWLLEGGVKYEEMSMPPDDMEMLQSRSFQIAVIASFFGVPSFLLNLEEKNTSWGTGIEQMNIGFLQFSIQPYLKAWEDAVENQLLSRDERRTHFAEHDVDGFLRGDSKARSENLALLTGSAIMSRDEARKKLNLPPRGGAADELTIQLNMTLLKLLERIQTNAE